MARVYLASDDEMHQLFARIGRVEARGGEDAARAIRIEVICWAREMGFEARSVADLAAYPRRELASARRDDHFGEAPCDTESARR